MPETPLPRDPGKSASLPLAEALSIVEPGSTATSGAPTRGTKPDGDGRRSTRLSDGNSDDKLFEGAQPSAHCERTSSTTSGARFMSGFWSTGPHPGYVLEGGARLPAQPSVDARTCWYKLPSSVIGEEPLAVDARVEIEHRNSLLDESFLSDDAEKPGGDVCCSKAV